METQLSVRYAANLYGVLSCYDRMVIMVIMGTLPGACYAGGMTSFLYSQGVRIFDYAKYFEPLRARIRTRALEVCAGAGIEIEHVNKSHIRKEDLVQRVLSKRGSRVGLVHVLSAMEAAPVTARGMTRPVARPICAGTRASACTTTSISSTRNSDCVICACPPGRRVRLGVASKNHF